ncbi:MAG: DMT family transporter [Actinomycetota bacterium]
MTSRGRTAEAVGGGLVAMASLQFGVVVVLGKLVQRSDLSVYAMLAVRFAIAAFVLALVRASLRQGLLPARGERLWLVGLGVIGYAVESALFFTALRHGQAAAVTLLFFTYPVFVAVASVLLGRGVPGPLIMGSLVCALAGAAIVIAFSGKLAITPAGVAFAIGCAVSFTAYLLVLDHVIRRTDPHVTSMWVAGSASATLAVLAALSGSSWATAGGKSWAELAGMGLATAGAFVCLFVGLRRLGPVRTSIVAAAEPLATTLLAWLILDERIRPATAIGGVLILVGAVAATLARATPAPEPPTP